MPIERSSNYRILGLGVGLLVSLAFLVSSPAAFAQSPPLAPSEADSAKREEARSLFEQGISLFDKKLWDPALAQFLASRAAHPTRSNTQNAALCLRNLNRFDEALDMFETLVREFPNMRPDEKQLVDREVSELTPLVGTLQVKVNEPGTTIRIDDRDRGSSPSPPLRVSVGTRTVRLFRPGFSPFERKVTVAGGANVEVAAQMEALTQSGRLSVVEETGKVADVLIDNVIVGKTPWQGQVAPGDHVVLLRGGGIEGTQPASATVRINQVTAVLLALEALASSLRVEPTPSSALVAIDGISVGNGTWSGRLRAGRHKLEIGASGFLSQTKVIQLSSGAAERVSIALVRDPDSPLWYGGRKARVFVEVGGGFPLVPSLAGELGDRCSGSCSQSFVVGGLAQARVGYEFRSGLGISGDLGYLLLSQTLNGRDAVLHPVGKPDNAGTVRDNILAHGAMLGASVSLGTGEKLPLLFRLGAGFFLGSVTDARQGRFSDPAGVYDIAPMQVSSTAVYSYAAPEIRARFRLSEKLDVSFGVQALMMIAISNPTWQSSSLVVAGGQGIATFDTQALMGKTLFAVNPGLGVRYDF